MSCNGCRILRKGCSETCILRPCLTWIQSPEAQANATLFVAKFYGRSDLMSFISAVPDHRKSAVFQSLLMEACGRTVNPVDGAVGLLSSGNWHVCQSAVDSVLSGGTLGPMTTNSAGKLAPMYHRISEDSCMMSKACDEIGLSAIPKFSKKTLVRKSSGRKRLMELYNSGEQSSSMTTSFGISEEKQNKLLKLFV